MAIRCIIVDDEPLARKGLALSLAGHDDFELIGAYGSVESALEAATSDVDVVFLDIEMPGGLGFDLIERWPNTVPLIVFVTAYNQYAVKAFEAEALDYILKPINDERFAKVLARIRARLERGGNAGRARAYSEKIKELEKRLVRQEAAISVKTENGYLRIDHRDLFYIEAAGDHTFLYLPDRHLVTRKPLKNFVAELMDHGFRQTHKSLLVNFDHVRAADRLRFGDYELTLSDGRTLRMSRRYRDALELLSPLRKQKGAP